MVVVMVGGDGGSVHVVVVIGATSPVTRTPTKHK